MFIISEDNSEQIGCYSDTRVTTPHLDSLAEDGVRYTRAFFIKEQSDPKRQPRKRSQKVWSHLKEFYEDE